MPPKASHAAGPRRTTPRATARKSVPRVAITKSAAKSTTDTSPETTPSSAAAVTSPEPVPSLTYPKIVVTPKSSPKTTSKSDANKFPATTTADTPLTSLETRKSPSKTGRKSTVKAVVSKVSSEDLSEVPATAVPETTSDATTETASKAESESALPETSSEKITEINLKTSVESRDPIAQNETLAEKASETAAIEAAMPDNVGESGQESGFKAARDGATKTGTRTVVKKTVRVVKKVVKKKVPKRVQKGPALSSSEESGKVGVFDNGSEKPNPSVLEVENLNPLEPERNASVSIEVENTNSDVAVSLEAEDPNSDPCASIPVAVENSNSSVPSSMQLDNSEDPEAATGKENGFVNENLSEAPVSDFVEANNNGNEGEKVVSTTETHLGDQNVGLLGNQNDELGVGEGEEGVKEEVENFDVGGLKGEVGMEYGLVLSGEMEALERRKRRKTEIFIGGLDKDAKEEDVRNIFQEVGEIVDVRLMMNDKTGKNKGFAFVRYASATDAKKALAKFARVEICGKQCGAAPVEGNDTIFLGNIDKKWKSEDIVKLLQEIGIEKIDKVTVMANPSNIECNRGFAFLELETSRDAQNAYRKLQKKDVFGNHKNIKVAWAEPLSEPDEEEMLKVKSVYAEYLPSSWDEEKVKDYFKKFGEIENVVLARNLRQSRRKDFAFVNYTTREDALACIEAFNRESLKNAGSKVNVKVSLAKPMPKGKQVKRVSNPVSKEPPKEKPKAAQPVIKPYQPRNKGISESSNCEAIRIDRRSSTTAELVQLLRQQASSRQPQTGSGTGSVDLDYPYSSPARKRPFSLLGDDPLYSDPRGYPRTRFESSFPAASPSYSGLSQSVPYYHQQGAGYASGSLYGAEGYPHSSQTRGGAPYHGSSGIYRRY